MKSLKVYIGHLNSTNSMSSVVNDRKSTAFQINRVDNNFRLFKTPKQNVLEAVLMLKQNVVKIAQYLPSSFTS